MTGISSFIREVMCASYQICWFLFQSGLDLINSISFFCFTFAFIHFINNFFYFLGSEYQALFLRMIILCEFDYSLLFFTKFRNSVNTLNKICAYIDQHFVTWQSLDG